jgi:hypothetical protein
VLRINVWPVGDRLFGAPSKSAPGARAPLDPPKVRPYGQPSYFRDRHARTSQNLKTAFPYRQSATSVPTVTALLSIQYAYPNVAVKITLILYFTVVNYSSSPLIIEAPGRRLCLLSRLLNLVACYVTLRYIVLSLVV